MAWTRPPQPPQVHDQDSAPMWSPVGRYMVVKVRGVVLMEQTLITV